MGTRCDWAVGEGGLIASGCCESESEVAALGRAIVEAYKVGRSEEKPVIIVSSPFKSIEVTLSRALYKTEDLSNQECKVVVNTAKGLCTYGLEIKDTDNYEDVFDLGSNLAAHIVTQFASFVKSSLTLTLSELSLYIEFGRC